jgi:two-component system repressor protein LuxO
MNLREHYYDFIGASEPMQAIYQKIERVAGKEIPVFITGETGTGKELCAKAIHKQSKRKDKPFFALNCAAIPQYLIESEIFGHVKGGFTGADKNREGAVSAADGGTLFLDEIGDMDLELQAKLLRFVETGSFYKVGNSKLQKVDIRLISATHHNIQAKIEAGRFRADLHYRLRVVSIKLPPLRERGQDMLFLARAFLGKFANVGHQFKGFTSEAENFLLNHQWPGNVRQLQHVIHSVVVLNSGEIISASMLQAALDENSNETNETPIAETASPKVRPLWQVEKDAIIEALDFCNGDVNDAAKCLEIGPATVYRKLRKYKIAFERTVKSS